MPVAIWDNQVRLIHRSFACQARHDFEQKKQMHLHSYSFILPCCNYSIKWFINKRLITNNQ